MCIGFSGAEILILLGDPSMLLTKLENPLFFRNGPGGFVPSPEKRLGLRMPFSDLGGVTSIMAMPEDADVCDSPPEGVRDSGLVWLRVSCGCCEFCIMAFCSLIVPVAWNEERSPEASKGAPIKSL